MSNSKNKNPKLIVASILFAAVLSLITASTVSIIDPKAFATTTTTTTVPSQQQQDQQGDKPVITAKPDKPGKDKVKKDKPTKPDKPVKDKTNKTSDKPVKPEKTSKKGCGLKVHLHVINAGANSTVYANLEDFPTQNKTTEGNETDISFLFKYNKTGQYCPALGDILYGWVNDIEYTVDVTNVKNIQKIVVLNDIQVELLPDVEI